MGREAEAYELPVKLQPCRPAPTLHLIFKRGEEPE